MITIISAFIAGIAVGVSITTLISGRLNKRLLAATIETMILNKRMRDALEAKQ